VVCTGFRREQVRHPLDGFGFLVPRVEGKRVLGCLWTSSLFPGRAPEGHVLLRTMYGGYTDPDVLALGDEELLKLWRSEVGAILGIEGDPGFLRIFRHARGIPQYLTSHAGILSVVEAAERQYPGLVFAGNAYRGVSLNDCVVSAQRAVDMLSDHVTAG
jgi:oxygen-dependent protoporphyrinogen oxidase